MYKFLFALLFVACAPYLYSTNPHYPSTSRVVTIHTKIVTNPDAFGAPAFVDGFCNGLLLDDLKVLTAAHCVADALWIGVNDTTQKGTLHTMSRYNVESIERASDLATLQPHKAKSEPIGDLCFDSMRAGMEVFLLDQDRAVVKGRITQDVIVDTDWVLGMEAWMSTLAVRPGDSGSPVFSAGGCVVGLVVARDGLGLAYVVGL